MNDKKIILPRGAGLVGQNLVAFLKRKGYRNLVVLDKHQANLEILRKMHPDIKAIDADLAEGGAWEKHFEGADAVVILQAQIGDLNIEPFVRSNPTTTEIILELIKNIVFLIRCISARRSLNRWPTTISYQLAIVLAYIVGMITAFILARLFVFTGSQRKLHQSAFYFVLVNLVAVAQTWLVSVGLAFYTLPYLGIREYVHKIAHAVGVVIPFSTSYIGHKKFSFG